MEAGWLVGDLLDIPGGHVEQLVSQLRQCPGRGELVADLRHVSIARAEPGQANTRQLVAVGAQAGDSPSSAVVFVDFNSDVPMLRFVHVAHLVVKLLEPV
jgi:hypothetical protein